MAEVNIICMEWGWRLGHVGGTIILIYLRLEPENTGIGRQLLDSSYLYIYL